MPVALLESQRAAEAHSGARLFCSQGLLSSFDSTAATVPLTDILENYKLAYAGSHTRLVSLVGLQKRRRQGRTVTLEARHRS